MSCSVLSVVMVSRDMVPPVGNETPPGRAAPEKWWSYSVVVQLWVCGSPEAVRELLRVALAVHAGLADRIGHGARGGRLALGQVLDELQRRVERDAVQVQAHRVTARGQLS